MRFRFRALLAGLCTLGYALTCMGAAPTAHARGISLRILYQGHATRLLAPGAAFVAVARGALATPEGYCLGLISLRDRYGIPVSVGVFRATEDGLMVASARVPERVFPAEPPGAFLLFVGRCTDVAPDGVYGSITVTIAPAAG